MPLVLHRSYLLDCSAQTRTAWRVQTTRSGKRAMLTYVPLAVLLCSSLCARRSTRTSHLTFHGVLCAAVVAANVLFRYVVLGNHDEHLGRGQGEIDFYLNHRDSRWILPAHWYTKTFSVSAVYVVVLFCCYVDVVECSSTRVSQCSRFSSCSSTPLSSRMKHRQASSSRRSVFASESLLFVSNRLAVQVLSKEANFSLFADWQSRRAQVTCISLRNSVFTALCVQYKAMADDQWAWIETTMKNSRADWLFVAGNFLNLRICL